MRDAVVAGGGYMHFLTLYIPLVAQAHRSTATKNQKPKTGLFQFQILMGGIQLSLYTRECLTAQL
jgi:hypothetical protein